MIIYLKFLLALLVVLMLSVNIPSGVNAAEDMWVKVTSPNGGESLKAGETYKITWDTSANIDKVAIGYTQGPGHLDWVEFHMDNTKSYDWKVFVGNTTRTQFKIEIIAYDTGVGSVTDYSDNYFTVIQAPTATPFPTPTSQPTPTSSYRPPATVPPGSSTGNGQNNQTFVPVIIREQIIQPVIIQNTWLSISDIALPSQYYFPNSKTTDLKKIKNPKQTADFTIDTKVGFTFVFSETLDLTKQSNLQAIDAISKLWEISPEQVWIKEEWWEDYDITSPIDVTYKNSNLTLFAPEIKRENSVTPAQASDKKTQQVLRVKTGEIKFQIKDGAKLKIVPRATIEADEKLTTDLTSTKFKAQSSHKNLTYFAKTNGKMYPLEVKDFDDKTGKFYLELKGYEKGNNFVQFYYTKEKDTVPSQIKEINLTYGPGLFAEWKDKGKIGVIVILALLFGFAARDMKKVSPAGKKILEVPLPPYHPSLARKKSR